MPALADDATVLGAGVWNHQHFETFGNAQELPNIRQDSVVQRRIERDRIAELLT